MQNPSNEWSITDVPMSDRTDAWQSVLCTSYREWQVPHRLPATFYAHVKQHDFAGTGIVETVCDPCAGQRTRGQVRHDDELYVGVQLTTGGRERFKIGDSGVEVASGDVVVWNGNPFSVYALADQVFIDGALAFDRAHPAVKPRSDFSLGQTVAEGGL